MHNNTLLIRGHFFYQLTSKCYLYFRKKISHQRQIKFILFTEFQLNSQCAALGRSPIPWKSLFDFTFGTVDDINLMQIDLPDFDSSSWKWNV